MRQPYSAKTLAKQLAERNSRSKMKPHGDPDGFGVWRTFTFDKPTSKTLERLIPEMDDRRIANFEMKDGVAHLTFVATPAADSRDEFPLDAADAVAGQSDEN